MTYSHETNTFEGTPLPRNVNVLASTLTIQEAMHLSRLRYDEPGLDTVRPEDLHYCEGQWIKIRDCRVGHRASEGTS